MGVFFIYILPLCQVVWSQTVIPVPRRNMSNQIMPEMEQLSQTHESDLRWLAFVRILSGDNGDELAKFRDAIGQSDWVTFLSGCHQYDKTIDRSDKDGAIDLFPTNPFFAAMFYNAQSCLRLMHEASAAGGKDVVDFAQLRERGFTAYHMLMSAVRFMSDAQQTGQRTDLSTGRDLVEFFHNFLFTRQQQAEMLLISSQGMTPMSWGVFLGLAGHVEYIILHHMASSDVHSDSVDIRECVSLDVTDCHGENLAFFTSPICVLLDVYSQSTLAELKADCVFRDGFLWKRWVEALFHRNRWMIRTFIILTCAQTFANVIFSGPGVNKYLYSRCLKKPQERSQSSTSITGILIVLLLWIICALFSLLLAAAGLVRKERYRRQVGYPNRPRRSYADLLPWFLPCAVSLLTATFLVWLYVDTNRSCRIFNKLIYPVSGCATKVLQLTIMYLIVWFMRLVAPISIVMSSFHRGLMTFFMFMAFYLVLTGVFARMFQGSNPESITTNSTTTTEMLFDYARTYYTTFLVSLNVVDTTVYAPVIDRVDLIITHVTYVLFVPVLFINFVIGVLSSAVNHVVEHEVENRYLFMLTVAEILERDYSCIRSLFNRLLARWLGKPKRIRIGGFLPITGRSRLFSCCDDRPVLHASETTLNESCG